MVFSDIFTTNAIETEQNKEKKAVSIWQRFTKIKQILTVEPLVICYVTAKAVCEPALKNLELEKACRVNAGFNDTVCNAIISGTYEQENFTSANNVVQSYITNMHSWQIIASSLLTILVILSLGSCSDRYKIRKPFLLFSMVGQIVEFAGCMLCVKFMKEWPLEIQGFAQEVVLALSGGEKLFLMVAFAYIADVSTPKMRTARVAVIQAVYNICYGSGQSFSGAILEIDGYFPILLTGLFLCVTGFLYGLIILEEPKKSDKDYSKSIILDILNPQHIIEPFKLFLKYKGACRINIISILVVLWAYSTILNGEYGVLFLFTQTAYDWTIEDFSFFMTITTIVNTIGLTFIVPLLTKILQLNDLVIIMLSCLNKILANLIYIFVATPTGLYIGCSIAVLKTLSLVGIRSQLTKYVQESDVCKILSLYTVVDSLSEGIASDIYNKGIYEYTRITFPQAFYSLGIALSIFSIAISICMYIKAKNELKSTDVKKAERNQDLNIALGTEITHM